MGLLYAPDSLKQLRVYPFWRPRGFERARRLSVELLDELKETARPAIAGLAEDERAELDEIVAMLTGNLEKIAEHGRRADGIVKSMLEHSRGVSGERREVDLNALVEEALNLAHHGARAQDANFNITLDRDLDPAIAPIELAPQEMTRVFLNLFGNGFYAATKRVRGNGEAASGTAIWRCVINSALRCSVGAPNAFCRNSGMTSAAKSSRASQICEEAPLRNR